MYGPEFYLTRYAQYLNDPNISPATKSMEKLTEKIMRNFDTGATRDSEDGKLDFEGFLSPIVLTRYAQYLNSHRKQADGKIRDSDNWQKGIPFEVYMKSAFRHFVDVWTIHRGKKAYDTKDGHEIDIQEALCAVLFNMMGYLHEDILIDIAPIPSDSVFPIDAMWSE